MSLDLRLYLVTDPAYGDPERIVRAAVMGGVTCVQVRDKTAPSADLVALTRRLRAALPAGVAVIANDDVDAAREGDGLHVGVDDLPPMQARELLGPEAIIGWSINDMSQLDDEAQLAACDYVAASPVWATPTKSDADRPWGLSGVRTLTGRLAGRLPLVAIGGVGVHHAADVVDAGADGIAVVSAIGAAADPRAAALELRTIVDASLAARKVWS